MKKEKKRFQCCEGEDESDSENIDVVGDLICDDEDEMQEIQDCNYISDKRVENSSKKNYKGKLNRIIAFLYKVINNKLSFTCNALLRFLEQQ